MLKKSRINLWNIVEEITQEFYTLSMLFSMYDDNRKIFEFLENIPKGALNEKFTRYMTICGTGQNTWGVIHTRISFLFSSVPLNYSEDLVSPLLWEENSVGSMSSLVGNS